MGLDAPPPLATPLPRGALQQADFPVRTHVVPHKPTEVWNRPTRTRSRTFRRRLHRTGGNGSQFARTSVRRRFRIDFSLTMCSS